MQAAARARIQPRESAAQAVHAQRAAPQIFHVHGGDFQFAARRWLQGFRDGDHFIVENIKARHGIIALGRFWFFLDGNRLAVRIEFHHAVTFRVVDVITKNGRARFEVRKRARERVAAVENVVAQNQGYRVRADERFRDEKCLRDARRFRLLAIFDGQAPRTAVAEQLFEARQIVRRGDQAQLADAALDERRERIINHRLVINRLELFARDERERIQPRTGAASKDDAFHLPQRNFSR